MPSIASMVLREVLPEYGCHTMMELARGLGLRKQYAWLLWHGKIALSLDLLRRIHEAFGVPVEVLAQITRQTPEKRRGRKPAQPTPDRLPPEVEAVNRALEAKIRAWDQAGLTTQQIANRLNKAGVPAGTETGRWDRNTVFAWLTDGWVGNLRASLLADDQRYRAGGAQQSHGQGPAPRDKDGQGLPYTGGE
jgi:transcriptional regulator with XRE-family HTH domain